MLVVIIMEALQMSASILDDLEMRIEDQTIIWQGMDDKLMIKDLTEDFAISHFCFRTAHLQEVADTLWSGPVCVDASRIQGINCLQQWKLFSSLREPLPIGALSVFETLPNLQRHGIHLCLSTNQTFNRHSQYG
jgi:hypothetical protein